MKGKKPRVLVAPLDWGLGHASRCIPIIEELIKRNFEVVVAADRRPFKLLQEAFPNLEFAHLKGLEVRYPKHLPMSIYMVLKSPQFFSMLRNEQLMIKQLVENFKLDAIISDNRYGLHHADVPSILITHQLFIQAPFLKPILRKLIGKYIKQFNRCWVPDFEGPINLSGELSHAKSALNNIDFIGPLSRFSSSKAEKQTIKRELMVLLSGPEPSRSLFERKILDQLQLFKGEVLVVRGLIGDKEHTHKWQKGNILMLNHLNTEQMEQEILQSEIVLCRAGYSSIMDLISLNKRAILVPTPGQTEQEYLAEYHSQKELFYCVAEDDLEIAQDIQKARKTISFHQAGTDSRQAFSDAFDQLEQMLIQ
jgi:uncharacterized protein (TIGR00661 family)